MIGDIVREQLPMLRAQAESVMFDSLDTKRQTGTTPDPATDVEVPTYATGYSGKARVTPFRQGHDSESGQVSVMVRSYEVILPWDATPAVERGDVVTVTSSSDVWVIGRPLVVTEVNYSTLSTCRRLLAEDLS